MDEMTELPHGASHVNGGDGVPHSTLLPLTALQEQLWFMETVHPGARGHVLTAVLAWRGGLDRETAKDAIGRAVNRHPALRSRFRRKGDTVLREVLPLVAVSIEFADADTVEYREISWELPPSVSDAVVDAPFDLESGPLVRFRVYSINENLHAIVVAIHHIIVDGWSVGIIARDIGRSYVSLNQPTSVVGSPGPSPEIRTADERPVRALSGKKLAYWMESLAGAPPILSLPTLGQRPVVRGGIGGALAWPLDCEIAARIDAMANRSGATRFTVCAAAAIVLLARLSGQNDVVVGVPLANRMDARDEEVVGFFANPMPIRVRLDAASRFTDVVDKTRIALFRALLNQDVPFERLVRELNPARIAGQNPVFQVILNHLDFREPAFSCGQFSIDPWPALNGGATFDFEIHFVEKSHGICLLLNYDRGLFDQRIIGHWAADFQEILCAFLDDPTAAVLQPSSPLPEKEGMLLVVSEPSPPPLGLPRPTAVDDVEWADAYPLSEMQMLVIAQSEANRGRRPGIYHFQQSLRVTDADPSPAALRAALQVVMDAEPMLRTRIVSGSASPMYQAVMCQSPALLEITDLTHMRADEQSRYLRAQRLSDREKPFGATVKDSLTHFAWFQLSDTTFEFAISIYQVLDDGWGIQRVLKQLFDLYPVLKRGSVEPLPVMPNVFKEYVALETDAPDAKGAEEFWKHRALTPHLSGYRERLAAGPQKDCHLVYRLPEAVAQGIDSASRQIGVSLKAMLLQGYMDVIAELTDCESPTIGMVVSERADPTIDSWQPLGMFSNFVPVGGPRAQGAWPERVIALQRALDDMTAHAAVPLSRICALHKQRDLFQVTFNLVNFDQLFSPDPDSDFELLETWRRERFHFPLNLCVGTRKDAGFLSFSVDYDETVFSTPIVSRLLPGMQELLVESCRSLNGSGSICY